MGTDAEPWLASPRPEDALPKGPLSNSPPFPSDTPMVDALTGLPLDGSQSSATPATTFPKSSAGFPQQFREVFGDVDPRTLPGYWGGFGQGSRSIIPPPRDTTAPSRRQMGPAERHPGHRNENGNETNQQSGRHRGDGNNHSRGRPAARRHDERSRHHRGGRRRDSRRTHRSHIRSRSGNYTGRRRKSDSSSKSSEGNHGHRRGNRTDGSLARELPERKHP